MDIFINKYIWNRAIKIQWIGAIFKYGRRIFSIQFAQELEQNICTAKFIPLVGFSDKEMKKYEDNPVPLFMLQLMKITIKDEFIFLIPISINASEGISGSIDLVDLSINGKSIVF